MGAAVKQLAMKTAVVSPAMALGVMLCLTVPAGAAIEGSFTSIPQGSNVNLTAIGSVDWVHWGLYTATSVNRKYGVPEMIGQARPVGADVSVFQFSDNFNGYSWSDGYPEVEMTNSTTGIWAYAVPNRGSGFELSVPAGTHEMVLQVFVGAFAGQGLFEAALSDQSGSWTNSALDNSSGNGPSGVYTVRYSALSDGQWLRIRWTLLHGTTATANVTLQAAALSAPGVNHLPIVNLSRPAPNQNIPFGSPVLLAARASDLDGQITKSEFFANTNLFIGETTGEPYVLEWRPSAPGLYYVTTKATDDTGGTRISRPVAVFVHSTGGTLNGKLEVPEPHVNLTLAGSLDWMHWGLIAPTNIDRKLGVTRLLDDFTVLGTNTLVRFTNYSTAFSWTDGTPTLTAVSNTSGVYVTGLECGFQLRVTASTELRRLRIYVGVYGAAGLFQAFLSDASAPMYADTSLDYIFDSRDAVYTVEFSAPTPGAALIVRYLTQNLYDFAYGSISLASATLVPGATLRLEPPVLVRDELGLAFQTELGRSYTIEYTDSLTSGEWHVLQSFTGTGKEIRTSDSTLSSAQRFYRLRVN
jgi:hypothetical protein